MANDQYGDLYFTREQLLLSQDETRELALDLLGRAPLANEITDKDRAFVQRVMLIAVDKSEKAGLMFDLYSAAIRGATKQSAQAIVSAFAKKVAKRWFKNYIDDTPKYSAAGRAAVQYSGYATDWRTRVALGSDDDLPNYII